MKVLYFKNIWVFENLHETALYGHYIMCNVEGLKIEVIKFHKLSCHIITYKFDTKQQVENYMLGLIDVIKLEETTRLAYMTVRNEYHSKAMYDLVYFKLNEPHIT